MSEPESKPELIVDARNRLGESAMWHPREQRLYWVDVRAPAIYRLEADNSVTTIPLPALVGAWCRESPAASPSRCKAAFTPSTPRPKRFRSSPIPSRTSPTTASTTEAATAWAGSGPAPST